jgi:hypothetical protein
MQRVSVQMFYIFVGMIVAFPCIASKTGRTYATHDDAVQFLTAQLICPNEVSPNPTPLLQYLVKMGTINLRRRDQIDSTSCWPLEPPFVADGLIISHICAFDTSDLVQAQHPDLYTREPGTALSQLTIFTQSSKDFTRKWLSEHILINPTSQLQVTGPNDVGRQDLPYERETVVDCEN